MSPAALWPWLESLPIAGYIGESYWFPLLESIHVLTATFLVGSILMVDLRLLGLAATNYPVSRVVKDLQQRGYIRAEKRKVFLLDKISMANSPADFTSPGSTR